tara:strand:+ start:158 stop:346 length:189 start_codon:yes stop_codon:yes gene_type:complete
LALPSSFGSAFFVRRTQGVAGVAGRTWNIGGSGCGKGAGDGFVKKPKTDCAACRLIVGTGLH